MAEPIITIAVHHYLHFTNEGEILAKLDKMAVSQTEIKESIMALTEQQQAVADALTAALAAQRKTAEEIVALQGTVTTLQGTIVELETAVNNAGAIPVEIIDLVAQVKAQAIATDEAIPDVVVPPADPV